MVAGRRERVGHPGVEDAQKILIINHFRLFGSLTERYYRLIIPPSIVLLRTEVHPSLESLFGGAVAVVPVNSRLGDAGVGGVDVVLVQSHGVKQGLFGLGRPSFEDSRVNLPDGSQGAVRPGVDVRLDVGKAGHGTSI